MPAYPTQGGELQQIQDFATKYEVSLRVKNELMRVNRRDAVRVINSLLSDPTWVYKENGVLAELHKVSNAEPMDAALEAELAAFVAETKLPTNVRKDLFNFLVGQLPHEIRYILKHFTPKFVATRENAVAYVKSSVRKYKQQRVNAELEELTAEFNFDRGSVDKLQRMTPESAANLLNSWKKGSFRSLQAFQVAVAQRYATYLSVSEETRNRMQAVRDHSRIVEDWSSDEDLEEEHDVEDAEKDSLATEAKAVTLDAQWASCAEGEKSGPQRFTIHSGSSMHSEARLRRLARRPTHFIFCVDTSGSMSTKDCKGDDGSFSTRLEAVLEECRRFITSSQLVMGDLYSLVTFNEGAEVRFRSKTAFSAQAALADLALTALGQTRYSMGMKGILKVMRDAEEALPAHAIFLSDGEPTDPEDYLRHLRSMKDKYTGDELKVHTIGFGESGRSNTATEGDFRYLQQMASIGRGSFIPCGTNLESLTGAFTALSTSISISRSSRTSRTSRGSSGLPEAAAAAAGSRGPALVAVGEGDVEDLEDSCSECSGDEPERGPDSEGSGARLSRAMKFELPDQVKIFSDLGNQDLWDTFSADQMSFKYEKGTFKRDVKPVQVLVRKKHFMQGGMRSVHGLLLQEEYSEHMCAKRFFQDRKVGSQAEEHIACCRSSAVASYYAKRFREKLKSMSMQAEFRFLKVHFFAPKEGQSRGYHFCGEKYLQGQYVKLNSNNGFVNQTHSSEHSEMAQAFSHFTFDQSYGKLMVVDVQGVMTTGTSGEKIFHLTDPQVHSRGAHERFGRGDLGDQGVRAFFQEHRCGPLCQQLGLKAENKIVSCTHTAKMPGVQGLVKWLLAGKGPKNEDSAQFFRWLRRRCRASTVMVPSEVYKDWLDIQLWSTNRGGPLAVEALQNRFEHYYQRHRTILPVPGVLGKLPVDRWEAKLAEWKEQCAGHKLVALIASPPEWREQGHGVEALWAFTDGATEADDNAICRLLHGRVDELRREVQQQQAIDRGFTKYADEAGAIYWYRDDDEWFYEGDPRWTRYLHKGKFWWQKKGTGLWFYEPEA